MPSNDPPNIPQPTDKPDPPDPYPSSDAIIDFTTNALSDQQAHIENLDGKANFVLGASTTLTGTTFFLQAGLPLPGAVSHTKLSGIYAHLNMFLTSPNVRLWVLGILLALYASTLMAAFFAYRNRAYIRVPNPTRLYTSYLTRNAVETKRAVYRAMLEAYIQNEEKVARKTVWVDRAFALLLLQALVLILALFLQAINH